MSDSLNNANPYEAYFKAMMEMQKEMANAYMASMQNGEMPPMMMPHQMGMMPHFPHPAFCHPHQMPPGMGHNSTRNDATTSTLATSGDDATPTSTSTTTTDS